MWLKVNFVMYSHFIFEGNKTVDFIRKWWLHILFWIVVPVYFMLAPSIYFRFFTNEGHPVQSDLQIPIEFRSSRFTVDSLSLYDANGLYQLRGWSFLLNQDDNPTEAYERVIVLISRQRNYVFPTSIRDRRDVAEHFQELGLSGLRNSGFSALISVNAIKRDTYKIGIIFKHPDGSSVYVNMGRCLTRTPNSLILAAKDSLVCSILMKEGHPAQADMQIPIDTQDARFNIERVLLNDMNGLYQLRGWGFLLNEDDVPTGAYERDIVLISPERNYVFPTSIMDRRDVAEHFQELGLSGLRNSGFSALISIDALEQDTYQIGFIFKQPDGSSVYVNTKRCLSRTHNDLILEDSGSPVCSLP